jgi:hypothetical protein
LSFGAIAENVLNFVNLEPQIVSKKLGGRLDFDCTHRSAAGDAQVDFNGAGPPIGRLNVRDDREKGIDILNILGGTTRMPNREMQNEEL